MVVIGVPRRNLLFFVIEIKKVLTKNLLVLSRLVVETCVKTSRFGEETEKKKKRGVRDKWISG